MKTRVSLCTSLVTVMLIVVLASCGPRLDSKDSTERRAAVLNLTDQTMLAKVAIESDEYLDVRIFAIEKLTDQALLAKVATEDKVLKVRIAAIERLTDQAVIAKMATEDKDSDVRHAAEDRIKELAGK